MKIEVTHDTTTIRIESEFLATSDIPHVTQMLLMLAEGNAEPSDLHHLQCILGAEKPPTVNVFVDGAKVAAKTEVGDASLDRHAPL